MIWTSVGSINLTADWQYTAPISAGEYFRLRHANFPANGLYQVAQAQVNDDGSVDLYNGYNLEPSSQFDIVQFKQPGCFSNPQRIAIRKVNLLPNLETQMRRFLIPGVFQNQSFSSSLGQLSQWSVIIESSDFVESDLSSAIVTVEQNVQAAIAQVTAIKTELAATKVELDATKTELDSVASGRATSSSASSDKQLTYVSDGDANGLFYWMGTNYGGQAWVNPTSTGKLTITSNGAAGDPESALVDRQGSNFYLQSSPSNYVIFTLERGKSLILNGYIISTRNVANAYLRSWKWDGKSADGSWTTIDLQTNNNAMNAPSQSLYVPVPNQVLDYNSFRLTLTGTDSSGGYYLCLGEVELYGILKIQG